MSVRMVAGCLLVALGVALATTREASAAPSTPQAKITWGVVTGTIYLNKRETAYLSLGSGAVSTFASALPPPANMIVSSASALLAAYAGKVVVDGKCMKIKLVPPMMFVGASVLPGTYGPRDKHGRYCR